MKPLALVPPTIDCPACEGSGLIFVRQTADGGIDDRVCDTCCGDEVMANTEFDPGADTYYCRCAEPRTLCPGEGCRVCDADYPEPEAPETVTEALLALVCVALVLALYAALAGIVLPGGGA